MEAKIEKISELSKLLNVKTRMSDDLFHLFWQVLASVTCYLAYHLEKHDGVSASELILSLCLFRIVGESIHSICKHKIYELSNHGKKLFLSDDDSPPDGLETFDEPLCAALYVPFA